MQKEYARNTVEFVRIGYHDACIDFTVRFREWSRETGENRFAELKQAIKAAGQYNEFDPVKVVKALNEVSNLIQEIQFGREGSPVLYLTINAAVWNPETETWRKYRPAELQKFEREIKTAFADTVFDEWSCEANVIRIWWD